jgi:hypothetical protein
VLEPDDFDVLLIKTTDCIDFLKYITKYINVNVTQQDTQRKLPDDDVHLSKHVEAVECINKLSEWCICWFIVHTEQKNARYNIKIKDKNILHDLTLIKMTVSRYVSTGCFLVTYTVSQNEHITS